MFSSEDLDPSFGENITICLSGRLHPDLSTTSRTYVPAVQPHGKQVARPFFCVLSVMTFLYEGMVPLSGLLPGLCASANSGMHGVNLPEASVHSREVCVT